MNFAHRLFPLFFEGWLAYPVREPRSWHQRICYFYYALENIIIFIPPRDVLDCMFEKEQLLFENRPQAKM